MSERVLVCGRFRDENGCRVRYFRLDGAELPVVGHCGKFLEALRLGNDHAWRLIAEDARDLYRVLYTLETTERAVVQIQDNDAAGAIVATAAVIEPEVSA